MATDIIYANRGIAFTLLAAVTWSFHALGAKISTFKVSPWLLCFVNSHLYLTYLYFIRWEYSDRYTLLDSFLILFAGVSGSANLCFATLGFSLTAIGNASAIIFSRPLICLILTKLFLREKLTFIDVLLTICNFTGVILILKPQFTFRHTTNDVDNRNLWGSLAALTSAFCGCIQYLLIRKLVERDVYDSSIVLVARGIVGYLLFGILMFTDISQDYMKTPADWLAVLSTCLLATVACSLVARALKSQCVSVVTLVGTIEVPASYLLHAVFTDTEVESTMVIGALLIVASPVCYFVKAVIYEEE